MTSRRFETPPKIIDEVCSSKIYNVSIFLLNDVSDDQSEHFAE